MVTLSRLYLRGVREGGVLGSPAPSRGSGGERSRSPTSSPLSWGRYPGPAFLGLLTYFPTVSGWAGRRARRRAGLDRPSALLGPWVSCRPGARGSRCRRSRPSCREHFGGAPRCRPAAPGTERLGRDPPDGGSFSRGPARPRRRSGRRLRLPFACFHPNLSLPGRTLLPRCPRDVDAVSAAPEREGCAAGVTLPGLRPGEPTRPAPRARLGLAAGCARCLTHPFYTVRE